MSKPTLAPSPLVVLDLIASAPVSLAPISLAASLLPQPSPLPQIVMSPLPQYMMAPSLQLIVPLATPSLAPQQHKEEERKIRIFKKHKATIGIIGFSSQDVVTLNEPVANPTS